MTIQPWRIERGEDHATLLSVQRMPHASRKGPMDAARRALRVAIADLRPLPGQIVEGVYTSPVDAFFDVENVLIYNVEPAAFRHAAAHGLRARRCRLGLEAHDPELPHRMNYRLIAMPDVPADPLVHLRFTPTRLTSVFDIWWAASGGEAVGMAAVTGRYGLHVEWCGPSLSGNPAARMKRLFGGIVAALQGDPAPDATAVERLSRNHGVATAAIADRLRNPARAAIPVSRSTRLVRPFGTGVQWHPADDLCEECTLVVRPGGASLCSACLYALPGDAGMAAPTAPALR